MDTNLSILNPFPKQIPGPGLLHDLLPSGVHGSPAIDYHGPNGQRTTLTYEDFRSQADGLTLRINHARDRRNVGSKEKNFIVPLLLPQCHHLYVAQLAILKSGGAFCPLPADAPEDRLRFILQDVHASVILTTSSLAARIPSVEGVSVILVDELDDGPPSSGRTASIESHSPAYVMYTSGSTGLPKGVLVSHAAVTQALLAHDRHIPQFSRFLQFASPTFDVSVFETFFTLLRGQTIVSCERTRVLADLPGVINSLNVDATELTPSVASNLLGGRKSVPGLKLLLTIGEMLKQAVVEEYGRSDADEGILYGMYGPTEATIHCTLQPSCPKDMPVGNIGKPLDTVSAFVVKPATDGSAADALPEIMPLGEEGELAVGGHQLADQYLNRPEQTITSFVNHQVYGTLYRTGDKARITERGEVICLGRISSGQVKLRGQRIELGEIEYAVSKTPGCKGAIAEVISNRLVAFCLSETSQVSAADIRTVCKKWLPAFMIPSEIIIRQDMPYLASGKIDRPALVGRYMECTAQTIPSASVASTTSGRLTEIADILRGIVGDHGVRGEELALSGVDSLTSIRVASEFGKRGFPQPMATQIMEARSVYDVAELLEQPSTYQASTEDRASAVLIKQRCEEAQLHPMVSSRLDEVEIILPCSAVQTAMLSETMCDPRRYCNWVELELGPQYDIRRVQRAVETMFQSHEILRAGFVNISNSDHGFASVIWKERDPSQIRIVQGFDYDFTLQEDALLRACNVQLRQSGHRVQLLLQIHHALYDQWSIEVFKLDMQKVLERQQVDSMPFSKVLQFYADHVESAISADSLMFWQDSLRGAQLTTLPNMNTHRVAPAQTRTRWRQLSVDTAFAGRQVAERGLSLPAVFQAAFAYLLSSYLGSNEVVYGVVFSGRHIPVSGIDRTFGPCLTTLPARVRLSKSDPWARLVQTIYNCNREMTKHADTPLGQIKQQQGLPPLATLFDSLFVWQESTVQPCNPQTVRELDSADHHEFNLVLELRPDVESISARLTYQQSLILPAQAEQILQQVEAVAQTIVRDFEEPVDQIGERLPQSLLSVENPRPAMLAESMDLVAELENTALKAGSQPAIHFADNISDADQSIRILSFQDLHARANRLARHLNSIGVVRNTLICVCMEKSIDFYVAILAALKAGAGYLPLVPDMKRQRAEMVLRQACVDIVLTDHAGEHVFEHMGLRVWLPMTLDLQHHSTEPLNVPSAGSDVAYTVFTSGSTGVPKGVTVTRSNLLGNLIALSHLYPHSHGDRLLQACLQSFDVAVFEIFFAFLTGMTLCSGTKDTLFADLERAIRVLKITHLSMTPTVAALVDHENVPSVQFLVTAGEAMTATVHNHWAAKGLYQGYGPSETTNICTVQANMSVDHHLGSIGPPLQNTSAFVIDPGQHCKILPKGAFGEFAFGGEQVFRGYLGLEELNQEKILQHPEYGRIYRSGDLGRMLSDGSLLIHGRADDQIKIRGNRIELGEINSIVLRHSNVQDCVTVALKPKSSDMDLVSFWKPQAANDEGFCISGPSQSLEEQVSRLYQSLDRALPAYMIPGFLVPVTNLPKTEQGKLDQRRLKASFEEQNQTAMSQFSRSTEGGWDGAGTSATQTALSQVLSETLQIPSKEFQRTSSLFSLGLNSFNAISFAKAVKKKLDKDVSITTILRNPSIARLARVIDLPKDETSISTPTVNVFPQAVTKRIRDEVLSRGQHVERVLPCTPLQEALLLSGFGKRQVYRNSTTLKINGDVHRLRRCFETVTARHAILRASFVETDLPDRPYAQIIQDESKLTWMESTAKRDISKKYEDSVGDHGTAVISPRTPFAIEAQHIASTNFLTLHMHHAIYDGTALAILLTEVEALYKGHSLPHPPSLEALLLECVRESGSEAMEFWSRRFASFVPQPFPVPDLRLPSEERRIRKQAQIKLSGIESFCRKYSVGISVLLQAAWSKCLCIVQDADDVCFGNVESGRSPRVDGVDRLVAPCFNTIPVRAALGSLRDNTELIRQLQNTRKASSAYQLTPLRKIQRLSKAPPSRLFDSLLLLQQPQQSLDSEIWQFEDETGEMGFPLVLEVVPKKNVLDLTVHHLTDRITSSIAASLADLFIGAVQTCLDNPAGKIKEILHLSTSNLHGVLRASKTDLQDSNADFSPSISPHSWNHFEKIVREVFSQVSKVDEGHIHNDTSIYQLGLDSLTSAQIATRLRSRGLLVDHADIMELQTVSAVSMALQKQKGAQGSVSPAMDFTKFASTHRASIVGELNTRNQAIESILPCTPVQCGMIAQSIQSSGSLYIAHTSFEVPSHISTDLIVKAWSAVQEKHPSLRTGFVEIGDNQTPFAMLTYRHSDTQVPMNIVTGMSTEKIEANNASAIAQSLTSPAWRLTVSTNTRQRVMTLSLHHALYDAESLSILLADFDGVLRGSTMTPSYTLEGILGAVMSASTEASGGDESFWRNRLQSATVSPFPVLTPRVIEKGIFKTSRHTCSLSSADLDHLCQSRSCTIQAAGQTAWARLLSSYLGESDVTFGTVFSSRTAASHESVVFPCINTVPIRVNVDAGRGQLLKGMVDYNAAVQRHRFTPLSAIQRYAGSPGRTLFDTTFVYQKSLKQADTSFSWTALGQSAAVDYRVSLELETPHSGRVLLTLTFLDSVMPTEHAELLLRQFEKLLLDELKSRDSSTESDSQLLSISPPKQRTIPSPVKLLHHFVEHSAQNTPNRPALEFLWSLGASSDDRQIWTYKDLDILGNKFARLLALNGAQPQQMIALCMNKCPEASVAFLGILKAGCSFVALDPDLPLARKEFILKDCRAHLLLTDIESEQVSLQTHTKILKLSRSALDDLQPTPLAGREVDSWATCYCLYTSGTTGLPKGCEISHENAVQAMMAFRKLFAGHWKHSSRWLQFASYWFDVSILEHFWSWGVGITVVAAPRDLVLEDLVQFINQANITHLDLTPSLARLLHPDDVPSLCSGVFITGGEALKPEIIAKWGSLQVICNGYGPTEATIGVTMNPFVGPDARPANIGTQFDNVGTFVLDPATDQPVNRGAIGELCVSGKLVGKGYLNRPELTAQSFPFVTSLGERIYRTGDLVRQLADGSFLFIGRQDSQAKLRGQRLETDEIDSIIKASNSGISDAASLVIKSASGNKQTLVTFVTTTRSRQSTFRADFQEHSRLIVRSAANACRDRLPGYMVPTHVIPVTRIPLTVNNKVDAKTLSELFHGFSVSDLRDLQCTSTAQDVLDDRGRQIASILSLMLSLDEKHIDGSSNVFTLGLSSVTAIRLATQLRLAGFSKANVTTIMRNPEVARLSTALSQRSAEDEVDNASTRQAQVSMTAFSQRYGRLATSRLSMPLEDVEAVAPCTPLQQGLIVESMKDQTRPYFNCFHFRLNSLDIPRLRQALRVVMENAQALRTKFLQTDEGYIQIIDRRSTVPIVESAQDCNGLNKSLLEARQRWIDRNGEDISHPFEILLTTTQDEVIMTLHLHHAIYDAVSLNLLLEHLADVYRREEITFGPRFTDSLPYGPLRQVPGAKDFWLKGIRSISFEPFLTGDNGGSGSGVTPLVKTSNVGGGAIESARKTIGTSHQAVIQACFTVALHQLVPRSNSYGMVVSGRSIPFEGVERILGPLFNTIPAPSEIQETDSWTDLVRRCHDFNVSLLPYQYTPLRDIKKWCNKKPHEPLFDVLFVFQHEESSGTRDQQTLWQQILDHPKAEYPFAFEAELKADGTLAVTVVAMPNVVDEAVLDRFLHAFRKAVEEIQRHRDHLVSKTFRIVNKRHSNDMSSSGKMDDHINSVSAFDWDKNALVIRTELALLSDVDCQEVDEHSTIFSLGLDSIDVVKLASRLGKNGLKLSVSEILRAQTIQRMLGVVQHTDESRTVAAGRVLESLEKQLNEKLQLPVALDSAAIERILPASPNQEAMLAEMFRSDFHDYLNHDILKLMPHVDMGRLREAWQEVVRLSPILRTSFVEVGDPDLSCVFAQVVHRPEPLSLVEISTKNITKMDGILDRIRKEVASNFKAKPPLRLTVVKTRNDRYLILSLCHAQYDGHSLALLHQDVELAYQGKNIERPSADAMLDSALQSTTKSSVEFWRNTLAGTSLHPFRSSKHDTPNEELHRTELASTVSTQDARAFCQQHGVSLQSLAQTCWTLALAHHTERLEVLFGIVLACRDSEDAEKIMFPAMNTVVIRAFLHGSRREMLRYVQDLGTETLPHQRTPLRQIQAAGANAIDYRGVGDMHGLFDTLFIYQHRTKHYKRQAKPLYTSVGGSSSIECPVAAEMEAAGDTLLMRVACKDHMLSKPGSQELLKKLESVLKAIMSAVDEPTLNFRGEHVSICSLPAFKLSSNTLRVNEQSPGSQLLHPSDDELNGEGQNIREVLAQVSRIPLDDVVPSSTVESLGIDSISAIKVASLLRKRNIKLSVSQIIRARTLSNMAASVRLDADGSQSRPSGSSEAVIAQIMGRKPVRGILSACGVHNAQVVQTLPATAAQVYMLSVWRMSQGRLFFPTFTYRLRAKIDVRALHAAWAKLVSEHAVLRTIFCATEDAEMPLIQAELRTGPDSFSVGEVMHDTKNRQPLANLQVTEEDYGWKLRLRVHHAVYDAVSLPLLIQDLSRLIFGQQPIPPRVKLTDFLALSTTPGSRRSSKAFWTKYLAGTKPLNLSQPPSHLPQNRVEIFRPGALKDAKSLDTFARKQGLAVQSLLFAAYAKIYAQLIQKTTSQTSEDGDVVMGIYLFNRSHLESLLELRHPTVNLVPLRVRTPLKRDVLDCARMVQQDLQEIGNATRSAVGLSEIAEWTEIRIDTFVNFLKLPEADSTDSETEVGAAMIEDIDFKRQEEWSEVVQMEVADFVLPKELSAMAKWPDVYQNSLDIEATITGGCLDMGLFVREDVLTLPEAENILEELRMTLDEISGRRADDVPLT